MIVPKKTTCLKYLDDTVNYIKTISKLFDEFDIKTKVTQNKLEEDRYEVHLVHDCSLKNLNQFADFIGFRYCHEKERYLGLRYRCGCAMILG